MKIEPKLKEYCSIEEALKYLMYGVKPCIGKDGLLVNDDSLEKFYINKVNINVETIEYKKAIALLEHLIRERKITEIVGDYEIINYSSFMEDMNEMDQIKEWIKLKKSPDGIDNVDIYFKNIKKNDRMYFINIECYTKKLHGTVSIAEYSFKDTIKFSEIEPYYKKNTASSKENSSKAINDGSYSTPLIQIVNEMIAKYGDKINQEKKDTVLSFIEELEKDNGYEFTENERKAIFRVIRKPETKIGGAKPHTHRTDL